MKRAKVYTGHVASFELAATCAVCGCFPEDCKGIKVKRTKRTRVADLARQAGAPNGDKGLFVPFCDSCAANAKTPAWFRVAHPPSRLD